MLEEKRIFAALQNNGCPVNVIKRYSKTTSKTNGEGPSRGNSSYTICNNIVRV